MRYIFFIKFHIPDSNIDAGKCEMKDMCLNREIKPLRRQRLLNAKAYEKGNVLLQREVNKKHELRRQKITTDIALQLLKIKVEWNARV